MQPATRIGPYEIIRRLGKSMNDVYLAIDTRSNRQAALKLIKSGPDAVSRLVMESERRGAAIQQGLRALDPRVIEVYDYGDLDGYFFVAMQYVEGRNLGEALARDGRMSAYRAARIALEICVQLEKFQAVQPVVHGDIKPSNIHLGPNETVRLLDFGIAKTLRPNLDFTFHNFGSPSYCSPERLGRSSVDQQADLWAVGATLYEMLSGSPPYQAENTRKLEKLIQSRRPPRALPASCPAALKAIAGKSLAPDPVRRYTSAAAFGRDLQAFLDGEETVAEKEKRGSWRPNPTLESARGSSVPKAARAAGRIAAALACVLTGMLLFIGTSYVSRYWTGSRQLRANPDWALYQDLQAQFAFLGKYSPVERLRAPLRATYLQAGTQIIERYDRSSDDALNGFDWRKAEACLEHARDLGAPDPATLAKLALVRGYAALREHRPEARDRFAEAERDLPQWPDPHVGLARTYLEAPLAPDSALAEIRKAERLGYTPHAREIEPVADAYRLHGFRKLEEGDTQAARQDFATARNLYSSVPSLAYRARQIPSLQPSARQRHKWRARRR